MILRVLSNSNLVFICFVCFRFHSWTEINEEGKKGFEPDSAEIRKVNFLEIEKDVSLLRDSSEWAVLKNS